MPHLLLDGLGVVAVVGELGPAGMSQHVGMDREGDAGCLTCSRHACSQRRATSSQTQTRRACEAGLRLPKRFAAFDVSECLQVPTGGCQPTASANPPSTPRT